MLASNVDYLMLRQLSNPPYMPYECDRRALFPKGSDTPSPISGKPACGADDRGTSEGTTEGNRRHRRSVGLADLKGETQPYRSPTDRACCFQPMKAGPLVLLPAYFRWLAAAIKNSIGMESSTLIREA
jgi:hypothetical protein